jgi:hypothetical protein
VFGLQSAQRRLLISHLEDLLEAGHLLVDLRDEQPIVFSPPRISFASASIIGSEGSEAFLRVKPLAAMPRIALRRAGKFMIAS